MLIEVHAKALDTGILLAEDMVTKSFAEEKPTPFVDFGRQPGARRGPPEEARQVGGVSHLRETGVISFCLGAWLRSNGPS
jgi:hypothetical protein